MVRFLRYLPLILTGWRALQRRRANKRHPGGGDGYRDDRLP